MHLFGRVREPDEMAGIWRQLLLTRAERRHGAQDGPGRRARRGDADLAARARLHRRRVGVGRRGRRRLEGQAGRRVDKGGDPRHRRAAATRTAPTRSRCARRRQQGFERLALVGMGCQTSSPPTMWDRKAGKVSKPFLFNIGLLCSKTFDDAIFPELFEAKYGLNKQDMVKMNIKGVFQIWMKDGSYHEIDLKECHDWTRQGCKQLPRLRRRARRRLHRRHRRGQRLDADHRAHRARRGGDQAHDRRRLDHRPPRPGGREGDEAAAPAVDRQPPPLARVRRPRPRDRRPAAEEEGRRHRPRRRPTQALRQIASRSAAVGSAHRRRECHAGAGRCELSSRPYFWQLGSAWTLVELLVRRRSAAATSPCRRPRRSASSVVAGSCIARPWRMHARSFVSRERVRSDRSASSLRARRRRTGRLTPRRDARTPSSGGAGANERRTARRDSGTDSPMLTADRPPSRRPGPAQTRRHGGSTARANTASSIGSVSRPVNVFCWLGWNEHSSVRSAVERATSTPCPNRGRGRTPKCRHAASYPNAPRHTTTPGRSAAQLAGQERSAGVALGRRRLVVRRRALDRRRDPRVVRRSPSSAATTSAGWPARPGASPGTASRRCGRR